MSLVRSVDPDFRVCQARFADLLEIQSRAEREGWATRWSSVTALHEQVKDATSLLQPILREERNGEIRTYRCLVLFRSGKGETAGGITTIDVAPEMLAALERVDRDPHTRKTLARIFSIASGGITAVSKE